MHYFINRATGVLTIVPATSPKPPLRGSQSYLTSPIMSGQEVITKKSHHVVYEKPAQQKDPHKKRGSMLSPQTRSQKRPSIRKETSASMTKIITSHFAPSLFVVRIPGETDRR